MANPQLENGRTEFANELVDALCRVNLSAYENRVLWFIARKTYGYHKKIDRIPYSQFENGTGIDHRHIGRAISSLKKKNMITVNGTGYALEYGIQKDYDSWKINTKAGIDLTPKEAPISKDDLTPIQGDLTPIQGDLTPKEAPNSVPKEAHSKAIKQDQKHITKANYVFVLPEWVNKELWENFVAMRSKVKNSPLTEYGKHLLVLDLEKLKDNGNDPDTVIGESIKRGWKGFFALKEERRGVYYGTNAAYKPQPPGTSEPVQALDGDAEAPAGSD